MKELPHNKGLRSDDNYSIDATIHNGKLTRFHLVNSSDRPCTYSLYNNEDDKLMSGLIKSGEIIDRRVNILILSEPIIITIKDQMTGSNMLTKRIIS
jgi:hypothetical protein